MSSASRSEPWFREPRANKQSPQAALAPLLSLVLIAGVYTALGLLVLSNFSAPIVDEPIYASSAFEFAQTGRVVISNLSAPNAVFDAAWGGLFVRAFGQTYEALRLSSIVLTALSAPFMYWLCRGMRASVGYSLLGTAAFLFAPIAFSLSTTFHTDPHALALIVISTALITNSLRHSPPRTGLLLMGSTIAAIGYLSRPQVLVVPIAGMLCLLITEPRSRHTWAATWLLTAPNVTAIVVHSAWISSVGEPLIRELSRSSLLTRGLDEVVALSAQALVMAPIYTGLFVLSLAPLLIEPASRSASGRRKTTFAIGAALIAVAAGLVINGQVPFEQQTWLTHTGLGAVDRSLLGSRPPLLPIGGLHVLTLLLLASAFLLARRIITDDTYSEATSRRFLVIALLGFIGAALASSLALQGRVFDRYWLPVLPIAIALALAGREKSRRAPLGVSVAFTVALALVSVLGTRDAFVAYAAANDFADSVTESGLDISALDGGASWSARTHGLHDQSLEYVLDRGGPYWMKFYAVETTPTLRVALDQVEGYEVVETREYRSLLHSTPTHLYLLQAEADDR